MCLVVWKLSFGEHEDFEVFDCYEMDLLHVCMVGHKGEEALFKHIANIVTMDNTMKSAVRTMSVVYKSSSSIITI